MTADRIIEVFKTLAKLIYLDQLGRQQATDLKAAIVAAQQQNAAEAGAGDPYAALQSFITPAVNSSRIIVQALDRVALVARSAAENYLRSLAGELNAQPTLGGASLMSAIATEMSAASQTVEEDGTIAAYVLSTWAIALPAASSGATIADDLVTAEIQ